MVGTGCMYCFIIGVSVYNVIIRLSDLFRQKRRVCTYRS